VSGQDSPPQNGQQRVGGHSHEEDFKFLCRDRCDDGNGVPSQRPSFISAPERYPEIREAIGALGNAKAHLQSAAHDFGVHRVEALRATDEAIHQLDVCMQYDRSSPAFFMLSAPRSLRSPEHCAQPSVLSAHRADSGTAARLPRRTLLSRDCRAPLGTLHPHPPPRLPARARG
jgi:hypothetical protein